MPNYIHNQTINNFVDSNFICSVKCRELGVFGAVYYLVQVKCSFQARSALYMESLSHSQSENKTAISNESGFPQTHK